MAQAIILYLSMIFCLWLLCSGVPHRCVWQTFSLALVTLFHITAGDPWPEEPSLLEEDGTVDWKVCCFQMAYEISVDWVVLQVSTFETNHQIFGIAHDDLHLKIRCSTLQVSVAALLDNFISSSSQIEMEEKLQEADSCVRDRLERNPMEPLLIKVAREFTDSKDLSDRLMKLYKVASGNRLNPIQYPNYSD
jgi:hypothetical protein